MKVASNQEADTRCEGWMFGAVGTVDASFFHASFVPRFATRRRRCLRTWIFLGFGAQNQKILDIIRWKDGSGIPASSEPVERMPFLNVVEIPNRFSSSFVPKANWEVGSLPPGMRLFWPVILPRSCMLHEKTQEADDDS